MAFTQNIILAVVILCSVFTFGNCEVEVKSDTNVSEGRTFGHHFLKRISFAIIPAAFVVGVITTLLAALTVVSMKGLGVGIILLILAIGQILSRGIAHTHAAAAYAAPAAVPVVYTHQHASSPVWVKEDW